MKKINISFILILIIAFVASSCVKDLDVEPIDPNVSTANNLFTDVEGYKQALAKIYGSYALGGQNGGGGGQWDIQGIDGNFGNYLRQLWGLNELSTDEAIISWNDNTIKDFHWHTWTPNDDFIAALYSRIFFSISVANEIIRTAEDGIALDPEIKTMQAEARFLRALSYYHAIDMFGSVPFVTEEDKPGAFLPKQKSRAELFAYVEGELKAIDADLGAPRWQYARADKAAAWMLLAKLYMNAEVYTGTARYGDALTEINKVLAAGYTLDPVYENIFRADNHTSPEIIYPIAFDGQNTQQYGGMTFIMHASNGGGMPLYGIDGGWGGIRGIHTFVEKMLGVSASDFTGDSLLTNWPDKRAQFFYIPNNWEWNITNVSTFTQGIGFRKFKNVKADDSEAPNAHPTFVSVDFPYFRLGDAYLMYAECFLRGGGGDQGTALQYVNDLRQRGYGDNSGNIGAAELTLDFMIEERGRELYWEVHRRTDLIRFGLFTGGNYLWEWKGNVQEGAASEAWRDLFPIPQTEFTANPTLTQNSGYN